MADASAVPMGAAETESRDRYRRTFFPRVLLSAAILALGLTHAPGSDATLFRWLGSWDPMDEAVVP